jgi:hypothetical protein
MPYEANADFLVLNHDLIIYLTENQFADGNSNPASKCIMFYSANIVLNIIYTFKASTQKLSIKT